MNLRDYENAKFELAGILRVLAEAAKDKGDSLTGQIRELFVRLAEDRFNLAVIGRFGRGKSSLMNAVIGIDRLPTGILPLTSVITTVVYGSTEKAIIHYEGRHLATEVELDQLPEFITQQANPGNVRHVRTAEVQLPAEILRRGFHFIDTPGLGSAIAENTRTTESFLPEADAMLVVTSYDSPLSEEEFAVLRLAARYDRHVFMVLNKHDTVTEPQRREGLEYVNDQLRRVLGPRASEAFSVSARDGLAAKLAGDADVLAASGIVALEEALVRFLVEEKQQAFLSSFCERLLDVTHLDATDSTFADVALQIHDFQRQLKPDNELVPLDHGRRSIQAVDVGSLHELEPCEICQRIQSVSFDFLCRYQYELSVSQASQDRHAHAKGLCVSHTRQLAALAAPRGVAVGYPALLDALSATLAKAANAASVGVHDVLVRGDVLPAPGECALCRLCVETLKEAVVAIAARLQHEDARGMESLSGICMLHLPELVAALDDTDVVERLLGRESSILSRLADDLRRYATKHDAIRRQLASAEETEAADRTLQMIAGLVNVHVPDASG
ncbi:MAG: dynamin family protein [Paraburkholderia sp.]|jgi:GTP-binding protein EngB required for normal cell division|uniref:dynamin family protein n=1 Tax=unclassified Paraburkholderia TaxID=2615204 RepID=UPI00285B522D|nr:dynamin family protein [Paraburkholderia sp. USG1]MDR8394777.1 dynamin family protein [Paraburkholderia sp. USG1]